MKMTTDELTSRFLKITKKMLLAVEEKNWMMLNHFLIERNDVIEFLDQRKEELTRADLVNLQEAWKIQNAIMEKMEQYRTDLLQLRAKTYQAYQAGRKYHEQFLVGNFIKKHS